MRDVIQQVQPTVHTALNFSSVLQRKTSMKIKCPPRYFLLSPGLQLGQELTRNV